MVPTVPPYVLARARVEAPHGGGRRSLRGCLRKRLLKKAALRAPAGLLILASPECGQAWLIERRSLLSRTPHRELIPARAAVVSRVDIPIAAVGVMSSRAAVRHALDEKQGFSLTFHYLYESNFH